MALDDLTELTRIRDRSLGEMVFDDIPDDDDLIKELIPSKREKGVGGRPKKDEDMLDLAEKQLDKILRAKSTTSTDRLRAIGMAVKFREIKAGLHTQAITESVMRLLDFLLMAEDNLKVSGEDAIKILTDNQEHFVSKMGVLRV